jgi:hypothetical protein
MANAEYERASARARLALIAPAVDEPPPISTGRLKRFCWKPNSAMKSRDQELISTLLDAVARKYLSLGLRDCSPGRSADDRPPPPIPTKS